MQGCASPNKTGNQGRILETHAGDGIVGLLIIVCLADISFVMQKQLGYVRLFESLPLFWLLSTSVFPPCVAIRFFSPCVAAIANLELEEAELLNRLRNTQEKQRLAYRCPPTFRT